jgi:cytochrome c-type biogenesis protein
MNEIGFLTAFTAGILSFLSPCVLPLLPAYLSFISGESLETLTSGESKKARAKAVIGAIFFGLGFLIVFVIFGATATAAGKALAQYKYVLGQIAGVFIIVLGLHMTGIFRINKLLVQKKWNYKKKSGVPFVIQAFLLGVALVLGWSPCLGPVIAAIFAIASQQETVNQGIMLLVIYGLGLWIPFLLSAFAISYAVSSIRKAGKVVMIVEKLSGLLLILIGLLMLTNKMGTISMYLIKWFPFLGGINF